MICFLFYLNSNVKSFKKYSPFVNAEERLFKMTAVEIATGIIDKLQEENRALLNTLHKAQDQLKQQDSLLEKKDKLIKTLEEKIRRGNDGILEMTNRQKELTIKHQEMQIQKLLKEIEDLEANLEAIKANICAKCETKLLLQENNENRNISKSHRPPSVTTSKVLFEKKSSQNLCPNRMKSLERIIEHKDKRITHLSKEVHRLTTVEKDLTQKVYRLTKLLPISRLPSETLTDCLLQEIQLLESQNLSPSSHEDLFKSSSKCLEKNTRSGLSFSSDKLNKSSVTNIKRSIRNQHGENFYETDADGENEVLCKRLQKIYEDVNELKKSFLFKSEKLSSELNCSSREYIKLKAQLEDIINNLNDIAYKMLKCGQPVSCSNAPTESDDNFVISRLQERLKESLELVFEYEGEIKTLNEKLINLRKEMLDKEQLSSKTASSTKVSREISETSDVKKLKEIIKTRDAQLEASSRHVSACEKFIEELQKTYKHMSIENFKVQNLSNIGESHRSVSALEAKNQELLKKLEVAEKTIETCKDVMEKQQNSIKKHEDENDRLENELLKFKRQQVYDLTEPQSKGVSSEPSALSKRNLELTKKVESLEKTIAKLESEVKDCDSVKALLEAANKENNVLKNRVEASEKHILSLEKNIEALQEKLHTEEKKSNEASEKHVMSLKKNIEDLHEKLHVEEKKCSEMESQLQQVYQEKNLANKYEIDIATLKNELSLKEQENRDLKESLHDLETKSLEMNHYRNSLHQEIEKLCNIIMEHDDSENDHSKRRAIYKAAVLHSAQALLKLDENFNLKEDSSAGNSALDEMRHQIEVYLTEVSRIHELVTIKEQKRDELLREYLNLNDDYPPTGSSARVSRQQTEINVASSSTVGGVENLEADASKEDPKPDEAEKTETASELKLLQEEIATTKSVIAYMVSSCTRLENLLVEEKTERARCAAQLESHKETVKDLKLQLNTKNSLVKRLNSLIDMMRSKECNDDIALEQLKSEIKWLIEENQKIFEKVSKTQTELCHVKEKNSLIENTLDSLKRQLVNEKYEHSKVLNELKHLRSHVSQCTSGMSDT